jgi:hypothetical protein
MGNAISLASLISSTLAAQSVGTEVGIATLKKSNDVAKQEGAALVQMLEESLPQTNGRILDTYA